MLLTVTYIGSNSCYNFFQNRIVTIDRLNIFDTDSKCFPPAPLDADHESYILRVV